VSKSATKPDHTQLTRDISRHIKSHTKPHKCDICGYGFALRLDLVRHGKALHQLSHERHYCPTDGCAYKTTRKDHLRKHRVSAHAWKPSTRHIPSRGVSEVISNSEQTPTTDDASDKHPSADSQHTVLPWICERFLHAAKTGNILVLDASLKAGIDVNIQADDGFTALHCAAGAGHVFTIDYLLGKGASLGTENDKHRTPLDEALLSQQLRAAQLLFSRAEQISTSQVTIDCLVRLKSTELLREYVAHLADDAPPDLMYRMLLAASRDGQIQTVEALLSIFEASRNITKDIGQPDAVMIWQGCMQRPDLARGDQSFPMTRFTPLHIAAAKGDLKIVRLLVENGVDINRAFHFKTPLFLAIVGRHTSVVEYMTDLPGIELNNEWISNSIQPDEVPRRMSFMPIHAAVGPSADIISLLLRHPKIEPNTRNSDGETPLYLAAASGRVLAIEALLRHRHTDPQLADNRGHTPLQVAACGDRPEIVRALLTHERDVLEYVETPPQDLSHPVTMMKLLLKHHDFRDINVLPRTRSKFGRQGLLHATIRSGHLECVQLLLDHKDIDIHLSMKSSEEDDTPLTVASEQGSLDIVRLLLQQKNINVNLGRGPLYVACKAGHIEIVKLLLQHNDIDINKRGPHQSDQSALEIAREEGYDDIFDLLLQQGATDHDATTIPSSRASVDSVDSYAVPEPHLEEVSDHELESQPYSFVDEYMEDLDGSEAIDKDQPHG
jgi:ankyrin repeat protein